MAGSPMSSTIRSSARCAPTRATRRCSGSSTFRRTRLERIPQLRSTGRTRSPRSARTQCMTTPLVNASKHDGVMVLELRNPPANTYSYEMMRELDVHILDARMDESIHVLMLTGAGDKFLCAGGAIARLENANPSCSYNFCVTRN